MAATRLIEVEWGTCLGFAHTHNGYYAGDFSRRHVTGGSRSHDLATTGNLLAKGFKRPGPGRQGRPASPMHSVI